MFKWTIILSESSKGFCYSDDLANYQPITNFDQLNLFKVIHSYYGL